MDLNEAIKVTAQEYAQRSAENRGTEVEEVEGTETFSQPEDLFEATRKQNRNIQQRSHYGARPYLEATMKQLEASPIKEAYQKAKSDIGYLKSAGDKQRAEVVRQQYMEDYYMPAVDAAVRLSSKQDVLSSREILGKLDDLVILDGIRGNGYTASLVANLYEDGQAPTMSDVEVQEALKNIVRHSNNGNIGAAIGFAKRIKEQIDMGNNIAIPEDYDLIQKVAIRG